MSARRSPRASLADGDEPLPANGVPPKLCTPLRSSVQPWGPESDEDPPRAASSALDADASKSESLRHLQKMETLGALAGGLAHDFNNILHSTKIYVEMTQEDVPDEHVAQDYLTQTLNGLHQAEALVEKLLSFSRPNDTAEAGPVDVAPLVDAVLDLVVPSFPDSLTVTTDLDAACLVRGDRSQLQQMIMNLVMNAGQAMEGQWGEQPTALTVSLRHLDADDTRQNDMLREASAPYVHLSVQDTGAGMDPEVKQRMFEPFFTTKRNGEGTGLGLAVVQGVIDTHDGRLNVTTTRGEGTTVDVYLPASPDTPPATNAMPSGESDAGMRVLVVDDEEAVRNMECIRLDRLGYEVTACNHGRAALDAVTSQPDHFDIVVTDHRMPKLNGLNLTRTLRDRGFSAPIVLVTGMGSGISEEEARSMGVSQLLQKPVTTDEMKTALAAVM